MVDLIEHAAPRPRIPVDTLLKERNELLPLYHRTAYVVLPHQPSSRDPACVCRAFHPLDTRCVW